MNRSNRTLASLDYTPRGTGVAPWQIEGGREREGKKNTRGGETGRELWWRHNSVSEPSWARVLRVSKTFGAVSPYVHNTLKLLPSLLSFLPLSPHRVHVTLFSFRGLSYFFFVPFSRSITTCPLSPRTYGRAFTTRLFFSVIHGVRERWRFFTREEKRKKMDKYILYERYLARYPSIIVITWRNG